MIDRLDVAATPAFAASRAPVATVVVIDVLRATSTIVAALEAGAAAIVPVRETDEAIAVMHRIGRERTLLCGERDSRLIAGFDLDNSPASYTRERIAGKTLVFTTTNGTRALVEAAHGGTTVYCAALINRGAVVERLAAATGDVRLLCAGSEGALSFEDFLGAGAIVDALTRLDRSIEVSDEARAAATAFAAVAKRLTSAIAGGTHARALAAAGFADDVAACSRIDVSGCVPRYAGGTIVAE
jgi:2-phosphosulfolactate phosphatase